MTDPNSEIEMEFKREDHAPPPPDASELQPGSPVPPRDDRYTEYISDANIPYLFWPLSTTAHESDECDCLGMRFGLECTCDQ